MRELLRRVAICKDTLAFRIAGNATAPVSAAWLLGCAAVAAAAHWLLATGPIAGGSIHPMIVLAAIAFIAGLPKLEASPAEPLDWALFGLALLACMMPFRMSATLALGCAAAISFRSNGVVGRAGGILLLALAGWGLKDSVWAGFASVPVLWIESHLVAGFLNLGGIMAEATGNRVLLPDGHSFVILRACSLLTLAYPCAVGTFSLCRLVRPAEMPAAVRVAAALGMLCGLNTGRLVAMACSPAIYQYLHTETGVLPLQLAWAGVIVLAALPSRRAA
nr:hypothetical protein [uncultured Rhodopila sp.]